MGITYKDSGVDIDSADRFIERIKKEIASTRTDGVVGDIGGFGGFFRPGLSGMKDPILVSSTDGVGTKLLIAQMTGKHDTVGIDLVAMVVNDIAVSGAVPLFFLDYIATGKLDEGVLADVVSGIAAGCREAGCALIGGETAEMPGFYPDGKYDLAGFGVGLVDRPRIIDGSKISPGDVIVGIRSSGLHSNGYSLARKVVFDILGLTVDDTLPGMNRTAGEELLSPTRIYVKALSVLTDTVEVSALAHITGGGLIDNIRRLLPPGVRAEIRTDTWEAPPIFQVLKDAGKIEHREMFRTFNNGIGMAVILPAEKKDAAMEALATAGEKPVLIGEIAPTDDDPDVILTP
ncbi:MAG: phosphoribosylformylglycinamidine cyclo-ligase [Deltaproteobacteria bacterium]|nr:phosphoribosylformylglycinamidine cyclo-ligase [Candidatus Zymogenaceae bacterium]